MPQHQVVNVQTDVSGTVMLWVESTKEHYATALQAMGDWEDGGLAIPAQELFRAVAAAPGEFVTLAAEDGIIRVESGTARWSIEPLAGVDAADFTGDWTTGPDSVGFTELVKALETVRYAAGRSENNRPSFAQVHVGEGRAVASDGSRLHQESFGGEEGQITFNIPEKAVDTLLEALSAEGDDRAVFVRTDDDQVTFTFALMQYVVGRSVYEFPDVDSIILRGAREQTGNVVVSIEALVTAVKVASVSVDDAGVVTLRFTHGVIEVEGHSTRSEGRMEVRAGVDGIQSGFSVRLRAADLLELLGKLESEDGDVAFTIDVGGVNPGWLYVQTGGTEAAVRPVIA